VDQSFDRATDNGYTAFTVVSTTGDDEHLGGGISGEEHLLLAKPCFGAGDRLRGSGQRFAEIQRSRLAKACFIERLS
jgi:hypothetical protein